MKAMLDFTNIIDQIYTFSCYIEVPLLVTELMF